MVHRNLLLQVNFLPLIDTLDSADADLSVPAPSVTGAPPLSYWCCTDMSWLNTAAVMTEASPAGSLWSGSEWDDGRP